MQEKNISCKKKSKARGKHTAKELPKLTQAFNKHFEHPRAECMQRTRPGPSALIPLPPRPRAPDKVTGDLRQVKRGFRPGSDPLLSSPPASPGSRGSPSPAFPPNSLMPLLPGLRTDGSHPRGQAPNCLSPDLPPAKPRHHPPGPAPASLAPHTAQPGRSPS